MRVRAYERVVTKADAQVDMTARANMSIRISKSCEDIDVLSLSELTRKLDIPVTRMKKAVDEGVIHPLGTIARAEVVALTDDELETLRLHFHPQTPGTSLPQ